MYAVTVDLDAGAPVRSRVEPGSGGDVRNQVTSGWAAAQHPPAPGMPTPGKTPCAAAALLCSSRGRPGSMEIDAFNSIDKVGVVTSFCMAC